MTSFGWLDGDDSQRTAMLEVVKLFEDSSTVDEMGIGSIRDTFSNTFFPGTSTLHTRARYLLFVPWLVNDVARHRWQAERALQELRNREAKLIESLLAGTDGQGVIGREAKRTLKSMPSQLYWASLEHLGIRTWRTSIAGYFRSARQHSARIDDPDSDHLIVERFGMASLPPSPDHLLDESTFELTHAEAEFLKARIAESARDSLFAWLAVHRPASHAEWIWEHEGLEEFPAPARALVDEARRVHLTATGPAILYNLLMAEKTGNDEVRDEYVDHLAAWAESVDAEEVFVGWDRKQFWSRILRLNPRIKPGTRQFLEDWWTLAEAGNHDGRDAAALVTRRELVLKRSRARLTYPDARSTWGVGSGTGALDYRWRIARRHLNDVAAGMES
ncbi:hypothetical protein F0U44_12200 [Nocardioides humilatus]|uniref:Uncharacterized protein n=1 Tax=Nocardioides humilatus TaxID=2607660 RepID=A0A5B1LFF9_9ACTN|nr:DUF6361 family protein [Nocardioides humilatus]KAA1419206.1 hypothetical protein F0U44_12200 [Nocardioides humilatus]